MDDSSDSCVAAIDDFNNSADSFASTFGNYIDNDPYVSAGDVVESGISYISDYSVMDTACDTGSDN